MTDDQTQALKAIRNGKTKADAFRATHDCDGMTVAEVQKRSRAFFATDEMKNALKQIERDGVNMRRMERAAAEAGNGSPADVLKNAGLFLINTAMNTIMARQRAIDAAEADPLEVQPYTANDIAAIKAGAALLEPYTDADGLAAFVIAQNLMTEEQ